MLAPTNPGLQGGFSSGRYNATVGRRPPRVRIASESSAHRAKFRVDCDSVAAQSSALCKELANARAVDLTDGLRGEFR
jgi:hypothetical protein